MFWNGSILFCYYTLLLSVVLGNILTEDAFIYLFLLCLFLLTFSPPELCNMFVLKNESYKNRAKSTKSILLSLLLTFTSGLLNIFVLRNESHTNRVKSTKSVSILLPFYSHLLLLNVFGLEKWIAHKPREVNLHEGLEAGPLVRLVVYRKQDALRQSSLFM